MSMITNVLREPLLYFLVAGAALFFVADRLDADDTRRVVVTGAERMRLVDQWQAQLGRDPTPDELEGLIEQWIREEIYYREAMAIGLDQDDIIIRRRLAQKLTFLTEDVATGEAADEATLRAYHQAHAERYTEPARYGFTHRYFSSDRRADAQADAREALESGEAEGDAFMLQRSYAGGSRREIADLFGSEFAGALVELSAGDWQGPVRSAYGWHLVKVDRRQSERLLGFEEVARRVAADFKQQRREANDAYYESLRSRYEVVRS